MTVENTTLSLATLALTALLAGCSGDGQSTSRSETMGTSAGGADVAAAAIPDADDLDLEIAYLIGPNAAREIDYRIDWQTNIFPDRNSGVKNMWLQGDSIFALDGRNFLTRIDRSSGQRLWRSFVAQPLDEVFGVVFIPSMDRVFALTESNLIVLSGSDGSRVGKQGLGQLASTAPLVYRGNMIYGARNGQAVWHSYLVGFQHRAYQVAGAMRLAPVPAGSLFIAASTDGRLMALRGDEAVSIWSKQLLDEIVATPVTGNGAVYVAGMDQHLRAYEATTGRSLWYYLTESKLDQPPTLMGDRVYQQIPSEGLVCFEAWPRDTIRGKVIWTSEAVGNVVNQSGSLLMVWNGNAHRMSMVHQDRGAVVGGVTFAAVDHIKFSSQRNSDFYAAANDGRVIRLVPR